MDVSLQVQPGRRHALQRLNSPSRGFSGALHVLGLLNFYHCFKYLGSNPNTFSESFGWHFQFLTIIGISISTLCFSLGLLADITFSSRSFSLKNYLALVAAPIEILISLLYWGLRAIDIGLVVPPDVPMLPFLSDLAFHFTPAVVLILDAVLFSPPWPTVPSNPRAPLIMLGISIAIAFAYWWWIELCYSYNGYYPYPLFSILTTLQRVGLFLLSGVTMWVVGGALRALYAWVNGYETGELEKVRSAQREGVEGKLE